ncbi:MAG: hypothetical protein WCJ26_10550 [bacterium]
MRKLLYIPIVHSKADLGSLGSRLSAEGEQKYGASAWRDHINEVEKSWDNIEFEISKNLKNTSSGRIKIYQDGLPVAGEIGIKIVQDAAGNGSKNYLIIQRLLAKGASLEIAENKDFLLREYYLLSEINTAATPEKQLESYLAYQEISGELLKSRDVFVANQINETLTEGDTGIAFFGASHSIIEKLNADIKVVVLRMFKDDISLNLIK